MIAYTGQHHLGLSALAALGVQTTQTRSTEVSPTASNTVYVECIVDPAEAMTYRYKSKCKRHRRQARGWR
jgi:hypothetical protein